MKRILTGAVLALIAMPAAAQQVSSVDRTAVQARPAADRVAPIQRAGNGDKAAYIAALRAAHKRAKNAVANGAEPARVRAKLQAYKQQLRRRWNATH
ncbi:MAG: hypothetical protein KUG65_08655 [Sphingomonadaceae bacterium]|nr:hypothetical protein [Sphingomonadaceae bacterium]